LITITFLCSKLVKEIRSKNYDGKYWDLFEIDIENKKFTLINSVSGNPFNIL